ncbi:enoyl-CoA hydratase/isomerase family protein [Metarhizium robertsii]|uniref:Crotonase, core n=2 Tax=Metarhizium robertsii TaxID=568076 RepID=E9F8M9_METRA|nr:Crotonase, core [Metarhizium robertsii ARSEF 23]EFY95975.1 Crotonase, core [Metarhizium robertsii ARSEF 23]EXU97989.1 enoyl-CoA hydratase/isomerase family protein [Metarhizium robertsii]
MSYGPLDVTKVTPHYWRATINLPPFNLAGPEIFLGLWDLLQDVEIDQDLKVLVFDSALPDFFISHYDLQKAPSIPPDLLAKWPVMMVKLATIPVISVAAIRGRTRGIGSEFVLACDIRFGSEEKAILSQGEVSFGLLPGGGGMELLPRQVTRGRMLEIVCGGDEFDAVTSAAYGWINRAVPDAEFETFVDRFARRVAGWEKASLMSSKKLTNQRFGLPKVEEISESTQTMGRLWVNPEVQKRMQLLFQKGLERDRDVELNIAEFTAKHATWFTEG